MIRYPPKLVPLARVIVPMCALLGLLGSTCPVLSQIGDASWTTGGDIMRGWRQFHEKKCAECHAVWDHGGSVGPDLGRIRAGRLTAGQLAGVMWNHIPKMLGQMHEEGRPPISLNQDEMADLFALIFFVRQLDEAGDPQRGESILRDKGCSECHQTRADGAGMGPDLKRWSQYANPIVWAQLMWEHAPLMEEAMKRSQIAWPKLEGGDLVHIVAYVRSTGSSGEKIYLSPGSVARGRTLFHEKNCDRCHPGTGPDLAAADLPVSVGALASRMWNHSPSMMQRMAAQNVSRPPLSAQELADIVAYVLALGTIDRKGNAAIGAQVFAQKGCAQCHEESGEGLAPRLSANELETRIGPVYMATAMWNHGETMLERMTEAGMSWPVFNDQEMIDLLFYLNARETSQTGSETGSR